MSHLLLEPFNPYGDRYPNRRVISRAELELIKLLRTEGMDVRIGGNPSHDLNYLSTKGVRELLSDPVIMTVVNIPLSIVCGVLSNVLHGLFTAKKTSHTTVILELDADGTRLRYTSDGTPIKAPQFDALLAAVKERRDQHATAKTMVAPDPTKPLPVYLEHTKRVVGWGRMTLDDKVGGLRLEDGVITDQEIWRRIKEGSLQGLSIGVLVRSARCQICEESYFDCPHIAGQQYGGKCCSVRLTELDIGEISIVGDPVNPLALIHWKGE